MVSVKETTSPYSVQIYHETLSNPLTLTNDTDDSFSSSTNIISLAGNSDYIYLVKDNDETGDDKSLYYTDDRTEVALDKLFYSKWWTNY